MSRTAKTAVQVNTSIGAASMVTQARWKRRVDPRQSGRIRHWFCRQLRRKSEFRCRRDIGVTEGGKSETGLCQCEVVLLKEVPTETPFQEIVPSRESIHYGKSSITLGATGSIGSPSS